MSPKAVKRVVCPKIQAFYPIWAPSAVSDYLTEINSLMAFSWTLRLVYVVEGSTTFSTRTFGNNVKTERQKACVIIFSPSMFDCWLTTPWTTMETFSTRAWYGKFVRVSSNDFDHPTPVFRRSKDDWKCVEKMGDFSVAHSRMYR